MSTQSDQSGDLFKVCETLGQIEIQFPPRSQQSEAIHEAATALAWIATQSDVKAAYQKFRDAAPTAEGIATEFQKYLEPEFTAQLESHFRAATEKAVGT